MADFGVEYVYVEEDGDPNDKSQKMQQLMEIVKMDFEGFEEDKHFQKTLIFTKDDTTATQLARQYYIQFKSKALLFSLNQFESPTKEEETQNEQLLTRFNTSSKLIGITNFLVSKKINFHYAKHFIFYDFPEKPDEFLIASEKIGTGAKKCELDGKISVFERGMTSVQKIAYVHALQNAGKSIPNSLQQFVINDRNLSENATTSLRELKKQDEVENGRSDTAPVPQSYAQQQQPPHAETPILEQPNTNNRNGSYVTVQGVEYKVNRNEHRKPELEYNNNCNPEKLIMIAKDLSFGDFNSKLSKEDFNFFHDLSPKEKNAFNNSVSEEAWHEILKTDEKINQFRHQSKQSLANVGIRELIEDVKKQVDCQKKSWDNHRRNIILIHFREFHILSMNNDVVDKACFFCNSHEHFSLLCVYYPTFEMRQFQCKEQGICNYCGGILTRGFDHRCPRDLECHVCGRTGHVKAARYSDVESSDEEDEINIENKVYEEDYYYDFDRRIHEEDDDVDYQ
ncbi:unnamed protein product [Caenorhabditis angaria]|uniref:Uncharacterized protein n=1 Tax=Caenorhabditis angaria TaxID=860376 RepID=A0A9P1IIV2_9PELO|nr:unnamed protein product [Caenorhabditis angaria]